MMSDGIEDEEKWLAEGIAGIQHNAFYMHRALVHRKFSIQILIFPGNPYRILTFAKFLPSQDANNLREALKYSAQMLSELRTSKLSPHKYYELCNCSFSFSFDSPINLFALLNYSE